MHGSIFWRESRAAAYPRLVSLPWTWALSVCRSARPQAHELIWASTCDCLLPLFNACRLKIRRSIRGTGVTLKSDRLPAIAPRECACSTLVRVLEAHGGTFQKWMYFKCICFNPIIKRCFVGLGRVLKGVSDTYKRIETENRVNLWKLCVYFIGAIRPPMRGYAESTSAIHDHHHRDLFFLFLDNKTIVTL